MKKYLILALFLMPINVLAYSDNIILGGENIGVHIDTPGVMIIGFYRVNGEFIKSNEELKVGDYIIKVNNEKINTIEELTKSLEEAIDKNKVILNIKRDNEYKDITIKLQLVDGIYKSGLYVKDSITGLGTLTYIDPTTKIYGALGHEVQESNSLRKVEVKEGFIFESNVTQIRKSIEGSAGEKSATYRMDNQYGSIIDNTTKGIYGIYEDIIPENTIKVANINDLITGNASIYTVINGNKKEEFKVNIDSINKNNNTKNISFTITDERLINQTGGIIQGMSGSPIVQNDKIIGAVTHVIVENPLKGYGIFIGNMLEEGDKIKNN